MIIFELAIQTFSKYFNATSMGEFLAWLTEPCEILSDVSERMLWDDSYWFVSNYNIRLTA